ncbi:MAG: hypothetical protein ABIZ30_04685 [Candidatus Limnocylindrales bacterium]
MDEQIGSEEGDLLQQLLERMFGPGADFRDGQRETIEAVIRGERTLVVQRTGWGKSLVHYPDSGKGTPCLP